MTKSDRKAWLKEHLRTGMATALTAVTGTFLVWLFRQHGPQLFQTLSKTTLWTLIGLLAVLSTILTVLLYVNYSPLRKAYGLLWDKRFNPHCPHCRNQVNPMYKAARSGNPRTYCQKCKCQFHPRSRDGEEFESMSAFWDAIAQETGWRRF